MDALMTFITSHPLITYVIIAITTLVLHIAIAGTTYLNTSTRECDHSEDEILELAELINTVHKNSKKMEVQDAVIKQFKGEVKEAVEVKTPTVPSNLVASEAKNTKETREEGSSDMSTTEEAPSPSANTQGRTLTAKQKKQMRHRERRKAKKAGATNGDKDGSKDGN